MFPGIVYDALHIIKKVLIRVLINFCVYGGNIHIISCIHTIYPFISSVNPSIANSSPVSCPTNSANSSLAAAMSRSIC